jgi:hypothetical protein
MAQRSSIGQAPPTEPVGKARPVSEVAPAAPVDSVAKTAAAEPVQKAAAVAAVERTAPAAAADRVASIAERLRRGVLTPSQAVEELVEDAVQKNLPGLAADSKLSQELRQLLLAYAKDDPYLASRIGRLGIQR